MSRSSGLLAASIQRREGLVRGSVVIAEHLQPVRRRAVAEVEVAALAVDSPVAWAPKSSTMCGSLPHRAGDIRPAGGGT